MLTIKGGGTVVLALVKLEGGEPPAGGGNPREAELDPQGGTAFKLRSVGLWTAGEDKLRPYEMLRYGDSPRTEKGASSRLCVCESLSRKLKSLEERQYS